jgi:protein-tyrosine phosphatase
MVAAIFALVGAVYLASGLVIGPAGIVLDWLGISYLVVALAYAVGQPALLGKRPDGSRHLLAVVVWPYLWTAWLAWQLRRCRREPVWNEVVPGLFLGRRPARGELPPDVTFVVDLTIELPRPRVPPGVEYWCLPTLDGRAPDERRLRALVRRIAATDGPVMVCCAAGHGRSALVVAAVLLARKAAPDPAAAAALVRSRRPGVRPSSSQRALLEKLFVESR